MANPSRITKITDYFNSPRRFMRSTNLIADFHDSSALESYTVTPFVTEALTRILDGLRPQSGRRAWRITGDYGVGKSSFALLLARLLAAPAAKEVVRLCGKQGVPSTLRPMLPVLVVGDREPLNKAIARALGDAYRSVHRPNKEDRRIAALADKAIKTGEAFHFIALIDAVVAGAQQSQRGVVLIVDELGKFLEYAVGKSDSEDIFVLQTIAERAARSASVPFVFVGLLHQGIHAYTEKLSQTQRHEWEKVAGRLDEIVFDQPLVHTATLVGRALGIRPDHLPKSIRIRAKREGMSSVSAGLFALSPVEDWSSIYPLHPLLLPVLVRFFARFGQHERSLFGFLLSNEAHGLQAFSATAPEPDRWYRLSDFFDYVRSVFGYRLSGESYRTSWLRLVEAVDRASDRNPLEISILKSVAILNLLDADDMLPTAALLRAAIGASHIEEPLQNLTAHGLLFRRGQAGGFRLWSGSSINLHDALADAYGAIGNITDIAGQLPQYLDSKPIAARRHYLKFGTLRYFDLKYCASHDLPQVLAEEADGDGKIVIALPVSSSDREFAQGIALRARADDLVVVVPEVLSGMNGYVKDIKAWEFVLRHNPELAEDSFAAEEADRQLKSAQARLAKELEGLIGTRAKLQPNVEIYVGGRQLPVGRYEALAPLASQLCDRIYGKAPKIKNELINRNSLSSAAAAARMRLIEAMFKHPSAPLLGIDSAKAPPEKSMYLSVLARGLVHREHGDQYLLEEPVDDDPLTLKPALDKILQGLEALKGGRVSVSEILESLRGRPLGIRDGVAPLLLAICLTTHGHEIAVYEAGTFLHDFGPADFLRLTKQPANFELQLCRVAGIRAEVFRQLSQSFGRPLEGKRSTDLLDVVAPLCRFAAQLPEYTRRTTNLDDVATRVRDALLHGTDPSELLFDLLPKACGLERFGTDDRRNAKRVEAFVQTLQKATVRLRDAYSGLLSVVVTELAAALGEDTDTAALDRAKLASRAARVAVVAREGRLRAFAQRLRDPGLNEDAWVEALASFVVSKPPARWLKLDYDTWSSEIAMLGAQFLRTEAAAFSKDGDLSRTAVRVGLTKADGSELARVVEFPDEGKLRTVLDQISRTLPGTKDARLAVLARMLWDTLSDELPDALAMPSQETNRGERK